MATAKDESNDDLQRELKALRAELTALVKSVKDIGTHQAETVSAHVRELIDEAGERVRMTASEAKRRGEAAADEVEAMITRHPLSSVLVALGLGFVIGTLRRR